MTIAIIGGGIGGLTLALALRARGVGCRIYEAAPEIRSMGVGINLLPNATRVLAALGLEPRLRQVSIETREAAFFDHHGKLIHTEAAGLFGGFPNPQFSIHRGELQMCLLQAVQDRLPAETLVTDCACVGFEQDPDGVSIHLRRGSTGIVETVRADALVACDGFHSVVRKQLHPAEGPAAYSGINMWRGTTIMPPFLTGASMVRAGSLRIGKMVIYPILDNVDGEGRQLVNWVAEIRTAHWDPNDWNKPGKLEDFLPHYQDWRFDWLDVPAMLKTATAIFEYPMVDRDPLDTWGEGRVTLLGDAAHPMYPRGSNGAAQAILDAEVLAARLGQGGPIEAAFEAYEQERRPATTTIVRTNRATPPDFIIESVYDRTEGRPFERIEDVISREDLEAILARYRSITGGPPPSSASIG